MAALVAWPWTASLATALLVAPAAAGALVAGELAAPAVADAQRTWRARGRLLFAIAYAAMIAIAVFVASAVPEPAVFGRQAVVFAALQPAFLLIAGALADVRLALVNSLVLVVLASLRGGLVAALAAIAVFVLVAVFLLADNAVRILGAYAARRGPPMELVWREGLALIAPVTAVLALLLAIAPPQPWAGVRWRNGPPTDLPPQVYALIFFASLIGAGAVGFALQFLRRRRQRTPPPTEDVVDVVAVEDEVLPEARPSRRTIIPGPRGAVVRAYATFLAASARLGRPRRADVTPAEYAVSLGRVAGLSRLTELFMDARYGPDEPLPESVVAAETAADEAVRDLRNSKSLSRHVRGSGARPD
jgi:hypothetical protein